MDDNSHRLNKHLAHTAGLSRRQADDLIAAGRVTIDGEKAVLGARFRSGQAIAIDGKTLDATNYAYTYIALNKPVGYVCSRRAQDEAPTIYELLPADLHHLKAVGRLDKDSSGLLLMTDDGDFAFEMTHPKFHKTKTYEIELDKSLEPLHRQMISDHGISLDDGPSKLQLERLQDDDSAKWRVLMHEGRNRQIRRTFEALGYTVLKLHRTNFGNYILDGIEAGQYQLVQK